MPTRSVAALVGLGALLFSCSPEESDAERAPRLGALELSSVPDAASVFLDGRYAGETGPEGPLRIVQLEGTYQVRVSARGHPDHVGWLEVRPERAIAVRIELARRGQGTAGPDDVRIGVGQVLRAELGPSPPRTAPAGITGPFHVYAFDGKSGQKRHIVLHSAEGALESTVLDPHGNPVPLRAEETPLGNPPETARWSFELEKSGRWRIVIHGEAERSAGGFYVFGLEKALPGPFEGETPKGVRRLLPGRAE